MKMLLKYRRFPGYASAMPFNENPFAAGSAFGLRPDYSNSIRGYLRNCRGCYWQNPIISSTYICIATRKTLANGRYTFRTPVYIHELSVHVAYTSIKAGKQHDPTVC